MYFVVEETFSFVSSYFVGYLLSIGAFEYAVVFEGALSYKGLLGRKLRIPIVLRL